MPEYIPEYDINSKDPLEMLRAIREKIYEETKHMTIDERMEYTEQRAAVCRRRMKEINLDDYDFSFLYEKVEKPETEHAESH